MLGTCRELRDGPNNFVSIVELSFNAIERSLQFYLVEQMAANSSDYRNHRQVFEDIAARGVFSDENVADRIDAFCSEHRSRIHYDVDRPGQDLALAMHELLTMVSSTNESRVVRVSQKGQKTIPKRLREKFGIETPGKVFVYEEQDRIIIEPVPSPDELHGIHAGKHERGKVLERVREIKNAKRTERLRPSKDR